MVLNFPFFPYVYSGELTVLDAHCGFSSMANENKTWHMTSQ
jgi:hypothetical protein